MPQSNSLAAWLKKNDHWVICRQYYEWPKGTVNFYENYWHNPVTIETIEAAELASADNIKRLLDNQNAFHFLFRYSSYLMYTPEQSNKTAYETPPAGSLLINNKEDAKNLIGQIKLKAKASTIKAISEERLKNIIQGLLNKLNKNDLISVFSTQDNHEKTPLHYAVRNCPDPSYFFPIIEALAKAGKKILLSVTGITDSDGKTIYHNICEHPQGDTWLNELTLLLSEQLASPGMLEVICQSLQITDNNNYTAAHTAIGKGTEETANSVINLLYERAQLDEMAKQKTREGNNLLLLAAHTAKTSTFELLAKYLDNNLSAQLAAESNNKGYTALHYSCASGDFLLVEATILILGEATAQLAIQMNNDNEQTPFHAICQFGDKATFHLLLENMQNSDIFELTQQKKLGKLIKLVNRNEQLTEKDFENSIKERTTLYQAYDYLVQRQKYLTRVDDFRKRFDDFIKVLKNLHTGQADILADTVNFHKRFSFFLFTDFLFTERYQLCRKAVVDHFKYADDKKESIDAFLDFLAKRQGTCVVAQAIVERLHETQQPVNNAKETPHYASEPSPQQ